MYKYMRNIVNNNDDFNERTNTLLYKNISLTLYSRKSWCWLCVRGKLETGTDCYILTPSSSDHSSTSFAFWLDCSTVGHWVPIALYLPLALNSASCLQVTPTPTDSSCLCPGYIFVWNPPASAVLPLIYIGTSLDWRLGRYRWLNDLPREITDKDRLQEWDKVICAVSPPW